MNTIDRECVLSFLPFDTEIFGIRCGRIEIKKKSLSRRELQRVLEKSRDQQIEHLVTKIPSEWVEICNLLEDHKFRFKMCSLGMENELLHSVDRVNDVVVYDDTENYRLIEITEKAFASGTRFHSEQKFLPAQIVEMHKKWIANLINDQDVKIYVHIDNSVITGYVTVKTVGNSTRNGHLGLFTVDMEYAGRGIGAKLISGMEYDLRNELDLLSATTESTNYKAIRTYIKNGFTVKRSWSIFSL